MMGEWTVVTDENGVAEFEVEYDDYIATLSKGGYATTSLDVPFREDQNTFTVTMRKFSSLTFTVVNEMGDPLERVFVKFDHDIEAWTDANGQVSFDVEYGNYDYAMSKDGYDIIRGNVTFDPEHMDFTVVMIKETGHVLSIWFHERDTGQPIHEGERVYLYDESGTLIEYTGTDEDGIVKFDVPHGDYTVKLLAMGYEPFTHEVQYTEEHPVFLFNVRFALTFDMRENGATPTKNLADVLVIAENTESGEKYTTKSIDSPADVKGWAWLVMPAGDYHITFSKNGYQTLTTDYAYHGDRAYDYIYLDPSQMVILRVVAKDEDDNPIPGASVKLKN